MNVHLRKPDASWIWAMCANFVPGWFLHEIEKSAPACHIFAQNMAPCSFPPPMVQSLRRLSVTNKHTERQAKYLYIDCHVNSYIFQRGFHSLGQELVLCFFFSRNYFFWTKSLLNFVSMRNQFCMNIEFKS